MLTGNEPVSAANLKAVMAATAKSSITVSFARSASAKINVAKAASVGALSVVSGEVVAGRDMVLEASGTVDGSDVYDSSGYQYSRGTFRMTVDGAAVYEHPVDNTWKGGAIGGRVSIKATISGLRIPARKGSKIGFEYVYTDGDIPMETKLYITFTSV